MEKLTNTQVDPKLCTYTFEDHNSEKMLRIFLGPSENGNKIGDVIIGEHKNFGYSWFEPYMWESTYKELIPDGKWIEIVSLYVNRDYRNMGVGNMLMSKTINILRTLYPEYKYAVLWMSPFFKTDTSLKIDLLAQFYNKFKFKSIPEDKLHFQDDETRDDYKNNIMMRKI